MGKALVALVRPVSSLCCLSAWPREPGLGQPLVVLMESANSTHYCSNKQVQRFLIQNTGKESVVRLEGSPHPWSREVGVKSQAERVRGD